MLAKVVPSLRTVCAAEYYQIELTGPEPISLGVYGGRSPIRSPSSPELFASCTQDFRVYRAGFYDQVAEGFECRAQISKCSAWKKKDFEKRLRTMAISARAVLRLSNASGPGRTFE